MFNKIKNRIEKSLPKFIADLDRAYLLNKTSPLLFNSIKEFILRKGKRVRPLLFIIGYLGYAKKEVPALYTSALSLELLHDFLLVHDDIIDKSDTRRGKPSMHKMLNNYLHRYKEAKFSGQDLTIVLGDVIYAMGLVAFLSVKARQAHKEAALKKLIEAVLYTGSGEFIELTYGLKNIEAISKEDIYKIYDLKTACYTFSTPLSMGALLAGANRKEADKLFKFGSCLGRAFQIKDDIQGIFADEGIIGKSNLTDLQEGKKTILIWLAYNNSGHKEKKTIKQILLKKTIAHTDLLKMQQLIISSQATEEAKKEIIRLIEKAEALLVSLNMSKKYKRAINEYSKELLAF